MVCAKCQKLNKTTLATPGVKKKSEMYYGSTAASTSASSSSSATDSNKRSATLGQNGISKSKLLSKAAKNPYAQYCHNCAFKADCGYYRSFIMFSYQADTDYVACAICGKANKKKSDVPVVNGQRFTLK
jgi:hypothetical protein